MNRRFQGLVLSIVWLLGNLCLLGADAEISNRNVFEDRQEQKLSVRVLEAIADSTSNPSSYPTNMPTMNGSSKPSITPTIVHSSSPTITPTIFHSSSPTEIPSSTPSVVVSSVNPVIIPSEIPSLRPSIYPSMAPTEEKNELIGIAFILSVSLAGVAGLIWMRTSDNLLCCCGEDDLQNLDDDLF